MPAEAFTFDEAVGPETFSFEDAMPPVVEAVPPPVRSSVIGEGFRNLGRTVANFPLDILNFPETVARAAGQFSVEGFRSPPQIVPQAEPTFRWGKEALPIPAAPTIEDVRGRLPSLPSSAPPEESAAREVAIGKQVGMGEAARDLGSFLATPEGLLSAAAAPFRIARSLIASGFGASMASEVAEAARQAGELDAKARQANTAEDWAAAQRAKVRMYATIGFPALIAGGAVKAGEVPKRAAAAAPKPEVPAAAVASKVEVSNAIRQQKAGEIHGGLSEQPGVNVGEVPAQVGPERVPSGELRPSGNAPGGVGAQPAGAGEVPLKPFPADRLTELEPPEGALSGRSFEVKEGEFTTANGQKYTKGTVLSEAQLRATGYEPPAVAVKAVEGKPVVLTDQVVADLKEYLELDKESVALKQKYPKAIERMDSPEFQDMQTRREKLKNERYAGATPAYAVEERLLEYRKQAEIDAPEALPKIDAELKRLREEFYPEQQKGTPTLREPAVSPVAERLTPAEVPLTSAQKVEAPAATAEPAMAEAVAMGASKPSEHVPARETATNITRARIDANRQEQGRSPLFAAARQKNPAVFDKAMAKIDQDPGWPDTLIAELSKKPRTPTPEEVAALDYRYVDLQNEYAKATRDMALAYDDGRLGDLPDIRARIDIWQEKLDAFEKVARASMSEWGRAGQISQQLMREDYSLVPMLARKRAAVGGRPLTDAEIMGVQKQATALAEAGKKADAATVAAEEKVAQARQAAAERDALKTELATVNKTPKPATNTEASELAKRKLSLQKRIVEITRRIEKREFLSRKGKPIDISMDPEAVRLQAQYEHLKDTFKEELERDRIRSSGFLTKAGIEGKEMLAFSRNIKSSTDVSAVLRQGAFITFGRPVTAARVVPKMFQALGNAETARSLNHSIKLRPNALDGSYAKGDLFLAPLESVKLAAQEELVMSRWAHRVRVVKASNRAYVTFLNLLRADAFDAMKAAWETKGKLTDVELQQLGNYINIATGRGNLGKFSAAAEPLALLFFSPRLATSRFQLLGGQPMWGGTARSRIGIAKEYGRFLVGVGVFYALAQLAGYKIGDDPRSTDFGKIRVGNTMLDPLAGLSQTAVLSTRLTTGQTADLAGHVTSILADAPYGKPTVPDVLGRFLRTKLAPVPSTMLSTRTGKDLLGRPITVGSIARDLYMPLSIEDILTEMKKGNNALPEDLAIAVLILFGMGAQTGDKPLPRP